MASSTPGAFERPPRCGRLGSHRQSPIWMPGRLVAPPVFDGGLSLTITRVDPSRPTSRPPGVIGLYGVRECSPRPRTQEPATARLANRGFLIAHRARHGPRGTGGRAAPPSSSHHRPYGRATSRRARTRLPAPSRSAQPHRCRSTHAAAPLDRRPRAGGSWCPAASGEVLVFVVLPAEQGELGQHLGGLFGVGTADERGDRVVPGGVSSVV